jgi:hypothetical protein
MVSRQGESDHIVHEKPFMSPHEVENPLLGVIKNANLHCMEKIQGWEVAHHVGHMAKNI